MYTSEELEFLYRKHPVYSTTVIFPVYNESSLIPSVFPKVADHARSHPDWLYRFVDDGSSDGTSEAIEKHLRESHCPANIILLRRTPNTGKASVIRESMLAAQEEHLLFTDGDLAYPLELLDQINEQLSTFDVVIGSRTLAKKAQTNIRLIRRILGGGFNILVRLLTGSKHHDTQAGLKGFRRIPAHALFRRQKVRDFAFDAELLFLAHRLNLSVGEIAATVEAKHSYKKSKMNLLKDPPRMLISIIKMRITHRGVRWSDEPSADSDPEVRIEICPKVQGLVSSTASREPVEAGAGN